MRAKPSAYPCLLLNLRSSSLILSTSATTLADEQVLLDRSFQEVGEDVGGDPGIDAGHRGGLKGFEAEKGAHLCFLVVRLVATLGGELSEVS